MCFAKLGTHEAQEISRNVLVMGAVAIDFVFLRGELLQIDKARVITTSKRSQLWKR